MSQSNSEKTSTQSLREKLGRLFHPTDTLNDPSHAAGDQSRRNGKAVRDAWRELGKGEGDRGFLSPVRREKQDRFCTSGTTYVNA